mmetsp:Transcript_10736/g.16339  ORF Transcript_10736/g.16339 Transcript_10736/m.16339 type:complete len:118 (+) Transcript_10736:239-592(+)
MYSQFEEVGYKEKAKRGEVSKEKQVEVSLVMRTSEYFDEEVQEGVVRSDMDIFCILNRSRIIVNVPTVVKVINNYVQLMVVLNKSLNNYNELCLDAKQNIIKALSRKTIDNIHPMQS